MFLSVWYVSAMFSFFFFVIRVLRNMYVGLVKYTLHVEVLNSVKIGKRFFWECSFKIFEEELRSVS